MLRRFFLVLTFLVGCFFVFHPLLIKQPFASLQSKLQQIPQEDKFLMEQFFKMLLLDERGIYVLFGDKPMTVADLYINCEEEEMTDFFNPDRTNRERIYRLGWQRWTKYAHLFHSKKFILKGTNKEGYCAIDLINKERFEQIFNEYERDFQAVLGKNMTLKQLWSRYMNGNVDTGDLLDHNGLYGTLLGYGRENAWLFHQMDLIRSNVGYAGFRLHSKLSPSQGFKTIEEERDFYKQKLQLSDPNFQYLPITFIQLPGFRADPYSDETHQLRKKYAEQRKKIAEIYQHGNFLEVTLAQFTSS